MIAEDLEVVGRHELHDLVDRLPAPLVPLVRGLMLTVFAWTPSPTLTRIGEDPPLDDEPVTAEDLAAWRDAGDPKDDVSLEEVRQQYARSR